MHMHSKLAAIGALVATAKAQCAGTLTAETHPALTWQQCTAAGSCSTVSGKVVVDSTRRWAHDSTRTNCYRGNDGDTSLSPDPDSCVTECCLDGADYSGTYGVTTSGNAMTLKFVTQGPYSKNIGSRLYLMKDDQTYQGFTLLGNEFTFDVDVSNLP